MTRLSVADPLAALRQATGAAHARLDSGLAIARPGASLLDYAVHLAATRGWLLTLAPCLDLAGFERDDGRLARIDADLADMARISHHTASAPPVPSGAGPLPASASDPAWCWGAAYVVEGASLGGRVLLQRLAPALKPHPLRYLAGDDGGRAQAGPVAADGASRPGSRWGRFLSALRAQLSTPAAVAAACDGALWAFEDFARRAATAPVVAASPAGHPLPAEAGA